MIRWRRLNLMTFVFFGYLVIVLLLVHYLNLLILLLWNYYHENLAFY